jgi:hypothetical protein
MGEYSKFISPQRRNVPTPEDLVEKGIVHFGTFDKEFTKMSILDAKKPTALCPIFNRLKLTLWEAVEIHLPDAFLLAVVCDMGIFGMCFNVLWDKKENKEYQWVETVKSNKNPSKSEIHIGVNLLDGSSTYCEVSKTKMRFVNHFEKGEAHFDDYQVDKDGNTINGHFDLEKVADPSIVSIPFGKNRPLCTEKMFFKATGSILIKGKEFKSDDSSVAVIDDHRAYYPRKAHYDWLTIMGKDKEGNYLGLNLTKNQSTNPEEYNENLIWRSNKDGMPGNSLLPPVKFTHSANVLGFKNPKETPITWECHDEDDMVNISFDVQAVYKDHERHGLGLVKIDYFVVFGYAKGYVRDENGKKIDVTGYPVMGEDKTLLL